MIEAISLKKTFEFTTAVNHVSFSVRRGEVVGLLGPNGAGKTTTMRMLTGYYEPTEGTVKIGGMDIRHNRREVQQLIGYLPESASSYHDMLVCDFLDFVAEARNLSPEAKRRGIERAVSAVGLQQYFYRPINQLSKGYKQRVGLAASLVHDPDVLILDEPTSGLDPNQIAEIQELLKKLSQEKTILLSTHILSEVEAVCRRAIIVSEGRIVYDDLIAKAGSSDISRFVVKIKGGDVTAESAAGALGITPDRVQVSHQDGYIQLKVMGNDINGEKIFTAAVAQNWVLSELYQERRSFAEVFRSLTGGHA